MTVLSAGSVLIHGTAKSASVIVPMQKDNFPYLTRIRKAEQIRYYPITLKNKELRIEIEKVYHGAEFEIDSRLKPSKIAGVADWTFNRNIFLVRIDQHVNIHIQFQNP